MAQSDRSLFIFGGWNGVFMKWFNDIFQFDMKTEEIKQISVKGTIPNERCSHIAAVYNNEWYIFGGYGGNLLYYNDMFKYNFATSTWENITSKCNQVPPPRSRSSAVVYGSKMYMLGGWNRIGFYNDFWEFNFKTFEWNEIHCPSIPSLSQHSMDIFHNGNNDWLIVYGGYDSIKKKNNQQMYYYRLSPIKIQNIH